MTNQHLAHIIYEDSSLRIKQILTIEHDAIAVEYGTLDRGHWAEYQGVTIRDDAIEGLSE